MQEDNSERDYERLADNSQTSFNCESEVNQAVTDADFSNPLETIPDNYGSEQMPVLSDEEVDRTLSLNGLTNEEIDARLKQLGEELEERWQKRSNMIRDLENLGPAPSRIEILVDAIADEFETPENAIGFVKMLVTKGLTPQQKIIEVVRIGINIIGKLIDGVKEIRRREEIVKQQIAVQGEIVVKTDEVKTLTAAKAENIKEQTGSNIISRHNCANDSINQAVENINSNTSEIDSKFSDYESERASNMNRVEDNGFNDEVTSRMGGLLDDINNL